LDLTILFISKAAECFINCDLCSDSNE